MPDRGKLGQSRTLLPGFLDPVLPHVSDAGRHRLANALRTDRLGYRHQHHGLRIHALSLANRLDPILHDPQV
jgi:hypothetical protein